MSAPDVRPPAPRAGVAAAIETVPADDLALLPQRINAAVQAAESHARSAVECAMRAGALLTQAKALVQHGEWETWLQQHVMCAPRTAQAYMRLHAKVQTLPAPEAQRVAGLPLREAIKAIATTPKDDSTPRPALPKHMRMRSKSDMERFHAELGDAATKLRTAARNVGVNALQRKDYERARKALTHALEVLDRLAADEVSHE
jgi:tetratricopeptide (TPR) repeat protein